MPGRSQGRYVAPLALVAFLIAFVIVVASSGGGRSSRSATQPAGRAAAGRRVGAPRRVAQRKVYVVRSGDLLSTISTRTGVPTDRLEDLNPDVDPQGLVPGQRIKLR